ncbi:hypothetical protein H8356DRAFT_1682237 [Neocallimastix lanati (nom. inval.)]|uniref:PX domain-containing protein n=1 Tax=Neocallimastix californiae TaxID=1754190 RepID=A0A1Y2F5W4_9FUNG|nr:hypothetical protein H8356DRAFT_1682237 [Neocallimastix sp. JGI-2020a]ORY78335.1 hypothetical protein LY90DRAFT_665062 [Neocallimastix californiae]|eukprot:ORY78335.1 hypothetical protein LY90DRAFT_665062 [Neocallimastix californiae]
MSFHYEDSSQYFNTNYNSHGTVIQILDDVYNEESMKYQDKPDKVQNNSFLDEDSFREVSMEYPDKTDKLQNNSILDEDSFREVNMEYPDKNDKDEKVQSAGNEIDCSNVTPQEPNNKQFLKSADIISNAEYSINIKHCCDFIDNAFKYENYNDYSIEITTATKKKDFLGSSYIAYSIQLIKKEGHQILSETNRRYSEFDMLHKHLRVSFPTIIIPPIPEKSNLIKYATGSNKNENDDMVEKRKRMLQTFLNKLRKHPVLCRMHLIHLFVQDESKWYSTEDNIVLKKGIDKAVPLNEEQLTDIKNKLLSDLRCVTTMQNIQSDAYKKLQELSKLYSASNEIYKEWSSKKENKSLDIVLEKFGDSGKFLFHQLQSTLQKMDKYIIDTLDQYHRYIEIAISVRKNCKNECMKFKNIKENLENKRRNLNYVTNGKDDESNNENTGGINIEKNIFKLRNKVSTLIDTDPVNTRRNEISNINKSIEQLKIEYEKQKEVFSIASSQLSTSIQQFEKEKREDFLLLFKQFAYICRAIDVEQYEFWSRVKSMSIKKDN